MEVNYRLGLDGGQIFVPGDRVARVRVAMAEEGLPSGGSIGYEIFDRSEGLGTTRFVQNINHLRALEGELARTIRSIGRIKNARVHLVLPRRALFTRDRQEPTASIVIAMLGSQRLERQQVLAVQYLVAAAIPNLKPANVSIIDSKGRLLARGVADDDIGSTASMAEEMRIGFEKRMSATIEGMLERSVGPGNVRAHVSAEMDFDRITENVELFDPDGQVVRSTQSIEEESGSLDGQGLPPVTVGGNLPDVNLPEGNESANQSNASRIEETVNYEISRTVKTHVRETGVVRRLSVAVLINGKMVEGADGAKTYEPRTQEELDQFATLVRSATGFDEERGDKIEIINMPFVDLSEEIAGEPDDGFLSFAQTHLTRVAELLVLGVVAVLVLLLVVRPLVGRIVEDRPDEGAPKLPGASARAALAAPPVQREPEDPSSSELMAEDIEQMIDLNKVEGRVRASSVRKIGEIVDKHPNEAVAIIRNWLYQET